MSGKYRKASGISDEERADIVTHLRLQGWPDEKGALQKVARHYNLWPQTIKRWATGESNPPPSKIVVKKTNDIIEAFYRELGFNFAAMDEARADASYRDLVTGVGIAVDKIQLLSGKATERTEQIGMTSDERSRVLETVTEATSTLAPVTTQASNGSSK